MSNVKYDNYGHLNLLYILYKGPWFFSLIVTLTMVRVSVILVLAVLCIVAAAKKPSGSGGKPGKPEGTGGKPNKEGLENEKYVQLQ